MNIFTKNINQQKRVKGFFFLKKIFVFLLFTAFLLTCHRDEDPFLYSENTMIKIFGGEFMMGNEFDSLGPLSLPSHPVTVEDFQISKYEVSVAEFNTFVSETGYKTDAEQEKWAYGYVYINDTTRRWEKQDITWSNPRYNQSDHHPVTCVSWNDAKAYCDWLTRKTSKSYRLPLEKEWEFIARSGGKSIKYPWGDHLPSGQEANFSDVNTPYPWADSITNDAYAFSAPCGSYFPNELGIFDLAGNVWEWCEDMIKTYDGKSIVDYEEARVMRGGSFHNRENTMRTAWRNYDYPNSRYFNLGFRVALSSH